MDWREAEREFYEETLEVETLARMFDDSAAEHEGRPAQKYKGGIYDRSLAGTAVDPAPDGEFATLTYGEMREVVRNLATGFRALGLEAGQRVGIFSQTRMEWAQSDLALLSAGGVVTTVYKSSSPAQVRYLLDDPGAVGVVVENEELLERVLEVSDALDLRFIISMDELSPEYADREGIYTLADVYEQGRKRYDEATYRGWIQDRDPEDLASLIYTSGTTGQPKGVRLTHENIRTNVHQTYVRYADRPDRPDDAPVIDETTQSASYLPLAHVFERTTGHFLQFAIGGCVAYAESPDTLKEDLQAVEPTVLTSVPRVYEKMYDAIREQASESSLKQRIFEWATDVSQNYERADKAGASLRAKNWLADKLVFSDVRQALGGNIEMLMSGGGTLSKELCALYHGMGLPIYEGYGLTEASPVVCTNPAEAPKLGTIGITQPGVEVKVDRTVVPEGKFSDTLGEVGELLLRGPNITDGYWNNPEATESSFVEDEDGRWFRTGDIVQFRPDDYIVFRERAKQIVVLSTGKNVAPAPIEDAFASSDHVEQCMVLGDGKKFIAALIVPDLDRLRDLASRQGIDVPDDDVAACNNEFVHEKVQAEVESVNEQFERHERIKEFRLVPREFTEENDLLTPTMKKKRRNILDLYDEKVADIYEDTSPTEQAEAAD